MSYTASIVGAVPFVRSFTVDVLSVIKQEHRGVSALFTEVTKCEPGDERINELANEIERQLTTHLSTEERLFYGPLRKRAEEQEEEIDMFEAYTEHEVARHLVWMLRSGRKADAQFKAELQVLGESVKHHVEEEESKVFAIARDIMGKEELEEIGAAWERAKKRGALKSQTQPGATAAKKRSKARKPSRLR
ncbi:MAG: hemerythrin domain-containing protein [Candidatus Cybelea sp.]